MADTYDSPLDATDHFAAAAAAVEPSLQTPDFAASLKRSLPSTLPVISPIHANDSDGVLRSVPLPLSLPLPNHVWLDPVLLSLGAEIGHGAFGCVWAGHYNGTPVAVKMTSAATISTSGTNIDPSSQSLALSVEAAILSSLPPHANIVELVGLVMIDKSLALVTRLCELGSLETLLLSPPSLSLSMSERVRLSLEAARGLSHLHSHSIVHGDIAARNYLLTQARTLKVSDFGLASMADVPKSELFAVQWSPPEVILHKQFSQHSDVWSYAVSVWEVFSGSAPFQSLRKFQVGFHVANRGLRLVIDSGWPPAVQQLMKACWQHQPNDRPPFEHIVRMLESVMTEADVSVQRKQKKMNIDFEAASVAAEGDVSASASSESRAQDVSVTASLDSSSRDFVRGAVMPVKAQKRKSLVGRLVDSALSVVSGAVVQAATPAPAMSSMKASASYTAVPLATFAAEPVPSPPPPAAAAPALATPSRAPASVPATFAGYTNLALTSVIPPVAPVPAPAPALRALSLTAAIAPTPPPFLYAPSRPRGSSADFQRRSRSPVSPALKRNATLQSIADKHHLVYVDSCEVQSLSFASESVVSGQYQSKKYWGAVLTNNQLQQLQTVAVSLPHPPFVPMHLIAETTSHRTNTHKSSAPRSLVMTEESSVPHGSLQSFVRQSSLSSSERLSWLCDIATALTSTDASIISQINSRLIYPTVHRQPQFPVINDLSLDGTLEWSEDLAARFTAPEVIRGDCDSGNDGSRVWQLGLLLWELAYHCQRTVFDDSTLGLNALLIALAEAGIENVLTIDRAHITQQLGADGLALLMDCLQHDPQRRPSLSQVAARVQTMQASMER